MGNLRIKSPLRTVCGFAAQIFAGNSNVSSKRNWVMRGFDSAGGDEVACRSREG
jgi:hypothetical protein